MATFYFNAAVDNDWATTGNWWLNDTYSTPAGSLPTASDDVVINANCISNSGSQPSINSLIVNSAELGIIIIVSNTATFNGTAVLSGGGGGGGLSTIYGQVNFNDTSSHTGVSYLGVDASTDSKCYFNDNSTNAGYILGSNNSSIVFEVNFLDSSSNTAAWVCYPYAKFYGFSTNNGVVSYSNPTYPDSAEFYDSSLNGGYVYGNVTFNNTSHHGVWSGLPGATNGTIDGNAIFNDSSSSDATINGNVIFNDTSQHYGVIVGNVVFNDSSYNFSYTACSITGNVMFNNTSSNYASTITGNAIFKDASYTWGSATISGSARFSGSSAVIMITNGYDNTYGSVIVESGINGSSVLGIV